MSTHKVNLIYSNDGRWYARCSCKQSSPWYDNQFEAEDWEYRHDREVQRARAHLNGRAPSVRDQYDYYRRMERDPDTPDEDRPGWKILADGLQHRIGLTDQTQAML